MQPEPESPCMYIIINNSNEVKFSAVPVPDWRRWSRTSRRIFHKVWMSGFDCNTCQQKYYKHERRYLIDWVQHQSYCYVTWAEIFSCCLSFIPSARLLMTIVMACETMPTINCIKQLQKLGMSRMLILPDIRLIRNPDIALFYSVMKNSFCK